MSLNNIGQMIANGELKLLSKDDTFKFGCKACGKCCTKNMDIIINPVDVYNMSKALNISSEEVLFNYATVVNGGNTSFPILLLKMHEITGKCVLLKNNKCAIHERKPGVCFLYPLGRVFQHEDEEEPVKYFDQGVECCKVKKDVTVRDFLGHHVKFEKASADWFNEYAELACKLIKYKDFKKKSFMFIIRQFEAHMLELLYVGLEQYTDETITEELRKRYDKAEEAIPQLIAMDKKVKELYQKMKTQEPDLTRLDFEIAMVKAVYHI